MEGIRTLRSPAGTSPISFRYKFCAVAPLNRITLISYAKSRPTRLLQFLKYSGALKLSQNQMERYFGDAMAKLGLAYDTIPKLK